MATNIGLVGSACADRSRTLRVALPFYLSAWGDVTGERSSGDVQTGDAHLGDGECLRRFLSARLGGGFDEQDWQTWFLGLIHVRLPKQPD